MVEANFKSSTILGQASRRSRRSTHECVRHALQLGAGSWAADAGAGGYYSMRIADNVGPTGKVFAETEGMPGSVWR
jgi:hypothetical protein